jgi:hypothetical protein
MKHCVNDGDKSSRKGGAKTRHSSWARFIAGALWRAGAPSCDTQELAGWRHGLVRRTPMIATYVTTPPPRLLEAAGGSHATGAVFALAELPKQAPETAGRFMPQRQLFGLLEAVARRPSKARCGGRRGRCGITSAWTR